MAGRKATLSKGFDNRGISSEHVNSMTASH
jgi:hypothetical protein